MSDPFMYRGNHTLQAVRDSAPEGSYMIINPPETGGCRRTMSSGIYYEKVLSVYSVSHQLMIIV